MTSSYEGVRLVGFAVNEPMLAESHIGRTCIENPAAGRKFLESQSLADSSVNAQHTGYQVLKGLRLQIALSSNCGDNSQNKAFASRIAAALIITSASSAHSMVYTPCMRSPLMR